MGYFRKHITFLLLTLVFISSSSNDKIILKGNTKEKIMALTFDDGPNNSTLPMILDFLKENDIKASFFFIGKNISSKETIVKRTLEEGHLILNHSYTHMNFAGKSKSQVKEELKKGNLEIEKALGVRPKIFRPPYGVENSSVHQAAKDLEMIPVNWNIDTLDWRKDKDVAYITAKIERLASPGSIVLMHTHPGNTKSYEALKIVVPKLKEQGYSFVTLDKLLGIDGYHLE